MNTRMLAAVLAALIPVFALAEDAKPNPEPKKRRDLQNADSAELRRIYAEMNAINTAAEAQIALIKLQAEMRMQPLQIEHNELMQQICSKLGVPDDKIATECVATVPTKERKQGEVQWRPAETAPKESK